MAARYVIDASVLIQYFIQDNYTMQAQNLFRSFKTGDSFVMPEFGLLECTNVIWKEVRFRGLAQATAMQYVRDLLALPFTIVPTTTILATALTIGLQHQLAIYDSAYIALARSVQYDLISADGRQLQAATYTGVTARSIAEFG